MADEDGSESNSSGSERDEENWKREDLLPDIGARLSSSDYTSFGEKLGFVTRDQIDPDDLALLTRKLVQHLNGNDSERAGYALFGLISLLTGCSDFIALKLAFSQGHSIWIDSDRGCWCWDFQAYKRGGDKAEKPTTAEPIFVALPNNVAHHLRQLLMGHPRAETLGDLMDQALGAPLDLKKFREFLRGCGDPVHPAYASRFAKSMPFVYLQTSGSDMSAAMLSGRFAVSAPAALFYFGPTYKILHQRLAQAYAFLSLGEPESIANADQRAGSQKVLEAAQLQAGWTRLENEILLAQARIDSATNPFARLADINWLMILLCAGFVIQAGHRGTRLERLTFGALLLHPDVILISDKDENDRKQPRLLPKTPVIHALISIAVHLHRLMTNDLGPDVPHDTCVFVQWVQADPKRTVPVSTGDIARVIANFFEGADVNFGRSAWVTHLDEDGCDRWLIRVLTGHTRDVTRTHGAYFDKPPVHAAKQLGVAMERTGHRIFGASTLRCNQTDIHVRFRVSGRERAVKEVALMAPDPRTLLPALSPATLAGWCATQRVRNDLLHGRVLVSPASLAIMHMLFVDFIPDADLCMQAIRSPDECLQLHGKAAGLLWRRSHFIHATWLPLLPTTTCLISQAQHNTPPSDQKVWMEIGAGLQKIDPSYWPTSAERCKAALFETTRGFLRLEFPPSLLAVADPEVPAPTLNQLSLIRLGTAPSDPNPPPLPAGRERANSRGSSRPAAEFKQIRKLVSHYTTQTNRIGELRKRALDCLSQIRLEVQAQTGFGVWIMDWVVDELGRSAADEKGRLDISSISTYLSVMTHRPRELTDADMGDPYEWSHDDWKKWINDLSSSLSNDSTRQEMADIPDPEHVAGITSLHPRVKDAVGRLIRNLLRRNHWVPPMIRGALAEGNENLPSGSASSCLIKEDDLQRAIQIGHTWLADEPLDGLMLEARARIQFLIPTRSSEISNLQIDCLTTSGQLVIRRVGYKNIKNDNSVRTVKAHAPLRETVDGYRKELLQYQPVAEFLFRGPGSPDAGFRDVEVIGLLSAALKHATGDPSARPHSMRAVALQNLAWKGWLPVVQRLFTATASPPICFAWADITSEWTDLARAASLAGHGDLRSAFGNYLAGWSLVFGVRSIGLLQGLKPRPAFLTQLGIQPASLRKHRQRSGEEVDEWGWVFTAVAEDAAQDLNFILKNVNPPATQTATHANSDDARSRICPDVPIPSACTGLTSTTPSQGQGDILYLAARILGMPKPQAMERTRISLSRATDLDTRLPPPPLVQMVSQRARSAVQERGRQGNFEVLFSDQGTQILEWVSSKTGQDRWTATCFIFKLHGHPLPDLDMANFWNRLLLLYHPAARCASTVASGTWEMKSALLSSQTQLKSC